MTERKIKTVLVAGAPWPEKGEPLPKKKIRPKDANIDMRFDKWVERQKQQDNGGKNDLQTSLGGSKPTKRAVPSKTHVSVH